MVLAIQGWFWNNRREVKNLSLKGKNILVTGGTGSFGKAFVKLALEQGATKVAIFSRDELKQHDMRLAGFDDSRLRYFIGDVREKDRMAMAMHGMDIVVHAAALKQVPALEYNPFEAVKTNIVGSQNVVEASIEAGVGKVVGLSTDKAVDPVNAYGASKLMAEKLFIQGNAYASGTPTKFSVVRYGNVIDSRGSVIPLFKRQAKQGKALTVTDIDMTRFFITLQNACQFVADALDDMHGGEIFVPKLSSCRISYLALKIGGQNCRIEYTGIRPGEKTHECLTSAKEIVLDQGKRLVIIPDEQWFDRGKIEGEPYLETYSSNCDNKISEGEGEIVDTILATESDSAGYTGCCEGASL